MSKGRSQAKFSKRLHKDCKALQRRFARIDGVDGVVKTQVVEVIHSQCYSLPVKDPYSSVKK